MTDIVWTNLIDCVYDTPSKTLDVSGYDYSFAGAYADAGETGACEFAFKPSDNGGIVGSENAANQGFHQIGLSDDHTNQGSNTISFSFHIFGAVAEIRELAAYQSDTTFAADDILEIRIDAAREVTYWKNNTLIFTSLTAAPVGSMRPVITFWEGQQPGERIGGVKEATWPTASSNPSVSITETHATNDTVVGSAVGVVNITESHATGDTVLGKKNAKVVLTHTGTVDDVVVGSLGVTVDETIASSDTVSGSKTGAAAVTEAIVSGDTISGGVAINNNTDFDVINGSTVEDESLEGIGSGYDSTVIPAANNSRIDITIDEIRQLGFGFDTDAANATTDYDFELRVSAADEVQYYEGGVLQRDSIQPVVTGDVLSLIKNADQSSIDLFVNDVFYWAATGKTFADMSAAFHIDEDSALVYSDDMESLAVQKGPGPKIYPTVAGNAGRMRNHNGHWVEVPDGAFRAGGLRILRNLISKPNDITDSSWTKAGGALALTATTATLPTNGQIYSVTDLPAFKPGNTVVFKCKLSGSSGDGTIRINNVRHGTSTYEQTTREITLTATPTPYAIALTTQYEHEQFRPGISYSGAGTVSIAFEDQHYEVTTGNTDPTIPSEFIDEGDHGFNVNGFKLLTYEHANTVDANGVVTYAQGAEIPLSSRGGYSPQGEVTEISGVSYALDDAAWIKSGGAVVTKSGVGLTGLPDELFQVEDTNATGISSITESLTISDDTNTYYINFRIPQDATPPAYPAMKAQLNGGTTPLNFRLIFDPSDGTHAIEGQTAGTDVEVTLNNGIYSVIFSLTNTGDGNTSILGQFYPAWSNDGTSASDSTLTETTPVASIEFYKDHYSHAPMLTTDGSPFTTYSDRGMVTAAGSWPVSVDAVGSMEIYVKINSRGPSTQGIVSAGNGLFLYLATSGQPILSSYDGTTVANAAITYNEWHRIRSVWGGGTRQFSIDGNPDNEVLFDASWGVVNTQFQLGTYANGAQEYSRMKVFSEKKGLSWLQEAP